MAEEQVKVFDDNDSYAAWVDAQDWYQTVYLDRLRTYTNGKVRTDSRTESLANLEFSGKRVLDIGCNSGQYCLFAKRLGASDVVGIDIDSRRIHQARTLAVNEGLNVDFRVGGIDAAAAAGRFDTVICLAVLTEVENVLGALRTLKSVVGHQAYLEMGLAKPLVALSGNRSWWRRDRGVSRLGRTAEMHRHLHAGWVCYPSLEIVQDIFGDDYEVSHGGKGLRYDIVHITRRT